jgi:putative autoinducer-2 (AI-2) aldolase
MAYNAVARGAAGVDMGRNIFQSDAPRAMMRAVHQVVHNQMQPREAYELFCTLKKDEPKAAKNAVFDPR